MLERFTPLKSTDNDTILAVHELFETAHQHESSVATPNEALRELVLSSQESEFYVARDAGSHIAVMGLYHFTRHNLTATVEALAVRADLRGRSLGSRALTELVSFAKDDRARQVQVCAPESRVAFYERHGFVVVDQTHYYARMSRDLLTI